MMTAADERWRISVHEAAHLVGLSQIPGAVPREAYLKVEGGGRTCCDRIPNERLTTDAAIMTLAGSIAEEELLPIWPPPQSRKRAAKFHSFGKPAPREPREQTATMSDDRYVALWVFNGHESQPDEWRPRYGWLKFHTELWVRGNAKEILKVARRLYRYGSVRLARPRRAVVQHDG
jgi:hypothetical protein